MTCDAAPAIAASNGRSLCKTPSMVVIALGQQVGPIHIGRGLVAI